jgi:hypothetical protein
LPLCGAIDRAIGFLLPVVVTLFLKIYGKGIMTRSILNSKFVFGLMLVAGSMMVSRSAQANEAMVAIPVTGGQFTLDVKIQSGTVANYGYQNNQLPTLLTPIGTVSLTNATPARLSNLNPYWGSYNLIDGKIVPVTVPTTTINEPFSIDLNITGQAGLNDGRNAQFTEAPTSLRGFATASSPISPLSIRKLNPGSGISTLPTAPLPENYQGTIAVQIQSGQFLVPSSAFSKSSDTVTPFNLSSGSLKTVGAERWETLGTRIVEYPETVAAIPTGSGKMDQLNVGKYNLATFDNETFVPSTTQSPLLSQVNLLSPMGTTSLSLRYLAVSSYTTQGTTSEGQWMNRDLPRSVSAVASGTVMLTNGQVVTVNDRLITFNLGTVEDPTLGVNIAGFGKRSSDINLAQGLLYIDSPSTSSPAKMMTSSSTQQQMPSVLNSTIAEPVRPLSLTPNISRDVLNSPLSTSRIFPEVNALR